jgi:hypothetical protein
MTIAKNKKRLRPRRGLGAGYTRVRRNAAEKVRQQREARIAEQKRQARLENERAVQRKQRQAEMADQTYRHSVLAQVAKATKTVLHSRGHGHVTLDYGIDSYINRVEAWTDFSRIVVRWPANKIPTSVTKHKEVLKQVADMKGVFLHEAGHIEVTVPWPTIMDVTNFREFSRTDNRLHMVWNLLEDQRMESILVARSPKVSPLFTSMVLGVILDDVVQQQAKESAAWLYLAGRTYLPNDLYVMAYDNFETFCAGIGFDGGADYWLSLVDEYKSAPTSARLGEVTERALKFITEIGAAIPRGLDDHTKQNEHWTPSEIPTGDRRATMHARTPGETIQRYQDALDGLGAGWGGGSEGGQSDDGHGAPTFMDELKRVHDDVLKMNTSDREAAVISRNALTASSQEGLPEYMGETKPMTAEQEDKARVVAKDIVWALNNYVTQASPVWEMHQERGIVDALAYRTKEIGSRAFRRNLPDAEETKLDVHLSLIADCSLSMGGNMIPLSEVMYGAALAAQEIGIGATFGLWSNGNQNYRVWSGGDFEPVVFPSMGGTDPTAALDDLENHNPEGAAHHLVLIFTDGAWGSFPSLQRWNDGGQGNRTIVLVRYGYHDGAFQGDMGADKHIQIKDVYELAGELTDALSGVLAADAGSPDTGW